jgi:hypothetical protein
MATARYAVPVVPDDGPAPRWSGRRRIIAVTAGVAVLLLATALVLHARRRDAGDTSTGGHSAAYPGIGNGRQAAPGWRLVASLGLEFEVPADWATNDRGCDSTDGPTVVRAPGYVAGCSQPETPTKQVAELDPIVSDDPTIAGYPRRAVTVDGTAAQRADGRLADGRVEVLLTVPAIPATLRVRASDPALAEKIVTSVHRVDIDSMGCATPRPTQLRPPVPAGRTTLVPVDTTEVDVCYYGEPLYYNGADRPTVDEALKASVAVTGAAAADLAGALNAAAPGHNRDSPDCRRYQVPLQPDGVLLFRSATGAVVPVYITSAGCQSRGIDNGARVVKLTVPLLAAAYGGLHTGYSVGMDIPGRDRS